MNTAQYLILSLLSASTLTLWANSVQYHVKGRIAWQALKEDAAARGEFVSTKECSIYSFTVDVEGCRWSVSLAPQTLYVPDENDAPGGVSANWAMLVVSDGHEFCQIMRRDPQSSPDAVSSATRGPGAAPFCVDRQIVMLWYVYASHCSLGGSSTNLLVPMESLGSNPKAFRVPARWELLSDLPKLPKVLTTYGYRINTDLSQVEILPPRESQPNVVLKVDSSTNVHGVTLPRLTSMQYYWVARRDGRTTSEPHDMAVIETLSVGPIAQVPDYPPKLAGRCLVLDYRFNSIEHSNMVAVKVMTDTGWPTEEMIRRNRMQLIERPNDKH